MINVQTLSPQEITISVREAYENLEPHDKEVIRRLANQLRDSVRAKRPETRFGFDAALEVLAALGIGINDNRVRFSRD